MDLIVARITTMWSGSCPIFRTLRPQARRMRMINKILPRLQYNQQWARRAPHNNNNNNNNSKRISDTKIHNTSHAKQRKNDTNAK
jgi:hypothetical protein